MFLESKSVGLASAQVWWWWVPLVTSQHGGWHHGGDTPVRVKCGETERLSMGRFTLEDVCLFVNITTHSHRNPPGPMKRTLSFPE